MAQTISELEKERAELLRQIEKEARLAKKGQQSAKQSSFSEGRAESPETPISLNDFLKAAQEVVPDELAQPRITLSEQEGRHSSPSMQQSLQQEKPEMPKKPQSQMNRMSSQSNASNSSYKQSNHKQGGSLFLIIIVLTLSLTFLGVMGLVYISLMDQVEQLSKRLNASQSAVEAAQKQVATSGQGEAFVQLEAKVTHLEGEVEALKQQLRGLMAQSHKKKIISSASLEGLSPADALAQQLDQKLALYSQRLEQKMDHKMGLILALLDTSHADSHNKKDKASNPAASSQPYQLPPHVSSPKVTEPKVNHPLSPSVNQTFQPNKPVVKMVKNTSPPLQPTTPSVQHEDSDIRWLKAQPLLNFTLQLASMSDRAAVERIRRTHHLTEAKVVSQKKANKQRYVLVLGSYPSREQAYEKANEIKYQTGISPWMRKISDIVKYAQ